MELFTEITAIAALSVVAFQELLKLKIFPLDFANKYPVPTNIVLSLVAAVIVTWQTAVQLTTWVEWVVYVATVSVVSAITYNSTLQNWKELRELESEVEK